VRLLKAVTIYARIGDVFAYASAVITVLLLLMARRVETAPT
jgi:apolipoprotein N-acyltransferase